MRRCTADGSCLHKRRERQNTGEVQTAADVVGAWLPLAGCSIVCGTPSEHVITVSEVPCASFDRQPHHCTTEAVEHWSVMPSARSTT